MDHNLKREVCTTADCSVSQCPGCLSACTPLLCFHTFIYMLQKVVAISVFIHICCLRPVILDFEKGDNFILFLAWTISREENPNRFFSLQSWEKSKQYLEFVVFMLSTSALWATTSPSSHQWPWIQHSLLINYNFIFVWLGLLVACQLKTIA